MPDFKKFGEDMNELANKHPEIHIAFEVKVVASDKEAHLDPSKNTEVQQPEAKPKKKAKKK